MQSLLLQEGLCAVSWTNHLLPQMVSEDDPEDHYLHSHGPRSLPQAGSVHDLPSGSGSNGKESALHNVLLCDRNLPEAGSLHNLHDGPPDLHPQSSVHDVLLSRRMHHSPNSLYNVPHGQRVHYSAGSLHNLPNGTTDLHAPCALHDVQSGLRNQNGHTPKVRASPGLYDDDSLCASRCVPHGSDLL